MDSRARQAECLVITGGGGFVLGRVGLDWLESSALNLLILFDRRFDDAARDLFAPHVTSGRAVLFEGDVTESSDWSRLTAEHGNAITHFVSGAALTPTEEDERARPADIIKINLIGNINALEFARTLTQLTRFVFISSDAVYGTPGFGRPEAAPAPAADSAADSAAIAPVLRIASTFGDSDRAAAPPLYPLTKWAGEGAVVKWSELFGLPAVCVRFTDVYGRGDRDTGARNRHNAPFFVARRVAGGLPVRIAGKSIDGLGWDYVDVDSVARGVVALLAAAAPPLRRVYDIASGSGGVTHRALIHAAGGDEAVASAVVIGARDCAEERDVTTLDAGHHLRRFAYDVSPMTEEFGWFPTPLSEAMAEYVAWLRLRES